MQPCAAACTLAQRQPGCRMCRAAGGSGRREAACSGRRQWQAAVKVAVKAAAAAPTAWPKLASPVQVPTGSAACPQLHYSHSLPRCLHAASCHKRDPSLCTKAHLRCCVVPPLGGMRDHNGRELSTIDLVDGCGMRATTALCSRPAGGCCCIHRSRMLTHLGYDCGGCRSGYGSGTRRLG